MRRTSLGASGDATLDGITISAPGIEGEIAVERGAVAAGGPRRARRGASSRGDGIAGAAPPDLERALRRQGMRTTRTVAVDGIRRERRGRPGPVTITTPPPRPGRAQVVLAIDHGVATWHYSRESQAEPAEPRRGRRRAAGPRALTYEIPQVAPPPGRVTRAGFIPFAPIIKVITFPLSQAVGAAARFAARRWDRENHPPRVRAWAADGTLRELTDADWAHLVTGRTLLFVHGTFSTTEGGFGALPAATRAELHRRYGGRVIAYDHPTIADDPFVNAREFYEVVGDRRLELDIVCHSRGGLVARSIAERPGALAGLGPNARVRQIVLVGVVNHGTILADADHWAELVDRYTTMLSLVPLPGAVATLETILAVVKSIAVETTHDLEGLSAMAPGSAYLAQLNVGGTDPASATYRAITSNFEPDNPDLQAWLNDEVRDHIFAGKPNDMMVAIESMAGDNGSDRFPIAPANRREFAPADAIEHAMYFGQPLTSTALLEWLTGG